MAYEAWEREHDENLVATLTAAKFREEEVSRDETIIYLGHLHGRVISCDGVVYWSVSDKGGEVRVNQRDIVESSRYAMNYCRKAVKNNLGSLAKEVVASAKRRLEANQ